MRDFPHDCGTIDTYGIICMFLYVNILYCIALACFLSIQAVKLESVYPNHNRYLVVVSTIDRQDTEESVILGVDIMADQATVGLVLTVWGDMTIRLDGDGYGSKTLQRRSSCKIHQMFFFRFDLYLASPPSNVQWNLMIKVTHGK